MLREIIYTHSFFMSSACQWIVTISQGKPLRPQTEFVEEKYILNNGS
jgi:hypothetical protein